MLSRADILPHIRYAELKEFRREIGAGDFLVIYLDGASGPLFTVVTSMGFDLIGTEHGGIRGRLKLSAILEGFDLAKIREKQGDRCAASFLGVFYHFKGEQIRETLRLTQGVRRALVLYLKDAGLETASSDGGKWRWKR